MLLSVIDPWCADTRPDIRLSMRATVARDRELAAPEFSDSPTGEFDALALGTGEHAINEGEA